MLTLQTKKMSTTIKTFLLVLTVLTSFAGFAQTPDQATKDDQLLKTYFAQNKIKATKTASGLYYVITKKGTGEKAKKGQVVAMKYLGKFLDGKKFDANVDDNFNPIRPFQFTLGVGQVIPGWDEGIQLLQQGSRATLYLPSGIGYGPGGMGPIPPNSVLVFDVEVVEIK